ncbi:MAG: hypothetical protein IKK26_00465 [Clostridia bacterium]|nr:hypothetical protein [Clostridia bacterium]
MRKLLSLVLVAAMLLSMVAAIPMNAGAADENKLSTEAEAYYFGGTFEFNELYGTGSEDNPFTYYGAETIKEGDASKGTLTIDGKIEEGEWGNPSFVVDSAYAANNAGFTSKANGAFEEPSADNSYFYYNKDSYKYANKYVKTPIESGMSYKVYLMWDEEFLYVAADVYDITGHSSSATDSGIWNADAFQFRVDKEGSYTRADGYNADGGKDEEGNHITNYPWKSSVIRGGIEFTSNVPNFITTYTTSNGGTTIIRDNANRYYPHEVMVDDPDSEVETDLIPETQYCDIDISYAIIFEDVCETYEDYKASNFGGQPKAVSDWGPAYAVAYPQKEGGTRYTTQYEIAIPWEYIDDAADFLAEAGDEFGFATMLLDRQNSLTTSYGAFLEWGNGVNNHRMYHDHATCNGSNSLTLSATEYNARADYHEHTYAAADCTKPETCTVCGHQRGFKTGHAYDLISYKLPTDSEDGYAVATCPNCNDTVNQTLAASTSEVYKWMDRNDGVIDLTSRLSSAFNAAWTKIEWTYATAEGATEPSWTPKAGAVVYNDNGANAGQAKNMLWLPGQTRPEIASETQVEVSGIVNPYDFTVLDLTCMSETGTYFHIYDFKAKNSTVTVDVNIWNRLSQLEREMEGETGYHDTMVFWFGPTLIEYAAGLFIVEDKDEDEVVTDTKYYFAIGPSGMNGASQTNETFKETALAYTEVDPALIGIGEDEWHNLTFFVDYDANVALLFWDGELVVGEYDYHFERAEGQSTADPIFRVFNLEMCLTDLYAGGAGLAAKHVNVSGGTTPDTDPIETDPIETDPIETDPIETDPIETDPIETDPIETDPIETDPIETDPIETDPIETDPIETEPVEPVLGSYENPYLLNVSEGFPAMPLAVTVKPQESAYVKVSDINNTVVTAGYATSASYMLNYLRFTYLPEGEDNATSFTMIPDAGMDVFSVYNTSETEDVVVYLTLAAGDPIDEPNGPDNPEELVLQEMFGRVMGYAEYDLELGNQGRFYKVVAPADGTFYISPGAYVSEEDGSMTDLGWMYSVNNVTAGIYGDTHWSDDEEPVYSEEVAVSEGDELIIMVATYEPGSWTNPAGTVSVNAIFAKTPDVGEMDNPEVIEIGDHVAEIVEGSQGYYYEWTATEKGTVTITMNDATGWMYSVENLTAGIYGEIHWFDDDPVVAAEAIDVEAGDVIQIMVNTYDSADSWNAPAGTVNWSLSFEKYVAPSVDYVLSGEVLGAGEQLAIKLDLSGNDEGLAVAILDLLYNTEALEFVSADCTDSVFENAAVLNNKAGMLRIWHEAGAEDDIYNVYENGEVFTAVFNILDPEADFGFELVAKDNNPANHTSVDEDDNPVDVEFTFAVAEDMPENGNDYDPTLKSVWMDVTGEMIDDKFHVYINLANTNNAPIWSIGYALNYNASVLALNSYVVNGDVFAAEDVIVNGTEGVVNVFANNDALGNVTSAGTMVELVFDVLAAGTADFEVTYDAGNVINVAGDEVGLVINVGEFELEAPYDGWVQLEGNWYFYRDGAPVCGEWLKDNGIWYYLEDDGVMAKNKWITDDRGACYVQGDGAMAVSKWVHDSIDWCYVGADGYMVTSRWVKDYKGWCYVDESGYMVYDQWVKDYKGWCYVDASGYMVYNKWVYDNNKWYFVDADGYMVANQWRKDSKGWVYLGADGAMLTNNWAMDSRGWCYVGADGYAVTNQWMKDSHGWIYLGVEGSQVKDAWIKTDGKWYYVDAEGYRVVSDWVKSEGKWYYFGADGVMATNQWITDDRGACYVQADGVMAVSKWVHDSKDWCYVGADGYRVTSKWVKDYKGWCYVDASGYMVYNQWVKDYKGWCYVDNSGYMVYNTVVDGYTIGADGYRQ